VVLNAALILPINFTWENMSNAATPKQLKLNDQQLFPTAHSQDGVIERTLDDGTVIQATVVGSQIVGYKAFDKSGKRLPVRRVRMKNGTPPGIEADYPGTGPMTCYYCICNPYPDCRCWPEPCPT
jgi:hypothetical protein